MGRCPVVVPETVRLSLSKGDWVEVKKRLNYGERRSAMKSLIQEVRTDGQGSLNIDLAEIAMTIAYLEDWSFVDPKGKHIDISTNARKAAALNSFDDDTVAEINKAVEAHVEAMEAEADAAKKSMDGENGSPAISPSAA